MTLREVLEALSGAGREAGADDELAAFLGELERIRTELLLDATSGRRLSKPESDAGRLLSVAEVARRIGKSTWWVYTNKDTLPIVRLPTGRYGFSEKGLDRWLERRAS